MIHSSFFAVVLALSPAPAHASEYETAQAQAPTQTAYACAYVVTKGKRRGELFTVTTPNQDVSYMLARSKCDEYYSSCEFAGCKTVQR